IIYEHSETVTDPTIMTEAEFLRTQPAFNFSGKVLFVLQRRGLPIVTSAELWDLPFFINSYIQYTNQVNRNDVVIQMMMDELDRIFKVNNNTTSRSYIALLSDIRPDQNLSLPQTDFVVNFTKLDVSRVS
ncbi:hypothetical protein LCGC14_1731290, partial [marine sediment metagenome]